MSEKVWLKDIAAELTALEPMPMGARIAFFVVKPCWNPWAMPVLDHVVGAGIAQRNAFVNDQWQQPGQQLVGVEGLDDVVVGALVQAEDAVAHAVARGHDQHRQVPLRQGGLAGPAIALAPQAGQLRLLLADLGGAAVVALEVGRAGLEHQFAGGAVHHQGVAVVGQRQNPVV